jgi:chromate reductase, NAD(P)H dehydrogenase (quinone)
MSYRIAVIVGSLRRESFNRQLADALAKLAPPELEFAQVRIDDLPLYDQDDDSHQAEPVRRMKTQLADSQGLLFVTPEYNRSIPGSLKNAIDWASRPWGKNSFARKPSAIIGTSPGKIGTAVAQQHLRSILAFCNSPLMNAIEAYIEFTPGLITDDGEVTNDSTREFLANYMKEFHAFIERVYMALPRATG